MSFLSTATKQTSFLNNDEDIFKNYNNNNDNNLNFLQKNEITNNNEQNSIKQSSLLKNSSSKQQAPSVLSSSSSSKPSNEIITTKNNYFLNYIKKIPKEFKIGIVISLLIIVIIVIIVILQFLKKRKNGKVLSKVSSPWLGFKQHHNDKTIYSNISGGVYQHHISTIIKMAAQLNAQSLQSKNLLLKLINATNALNYVNALEKIASANVIEEVGNINLDEFKEELENEQAHIIQKICHKYPKLQPDSLYTMSTGWHI